MNLFTGTYIKLTALNKEDLPTLVTWHQDSTFLRLFDAVAAKPKSVADLEKWYEDLNRSESNYVFAIRDKEDQLVGYVELDGILWNQGTGWISIAIGSNEQRKGYGKEAMELLLRFAFHELNLRRVQLTVFEYNEPAIKLYESLGFTREGAFREFLMRDGKTSDMILYGLLKEEWE